MLDLFDGFRCLVELDVEMGVTFFVTPREEDLERACVTVDRAADNPSSRIFKIISSKSCEVKRFIGMVVFILLVMDRKGSL